MRDLPMPGSPTIRTTGTVAGLRPFPAARQQCDLFLTADQRRAGGAQGLEPTGDQARA
jgi:hypothetical protein